MSDRSSDPTTSSSLAMLVLKTGDGIALRVEFRNNDVNAGHAMATDHEFYF